MCLLLLGGGVALLGLGCFVGFILGYAYHRSYNDGAELSGARASELFRRCISGVFWYVAHHYFQYELHYEGDARARLPHGGCIYASHPHGLFPIGLACMLTAPHDVWLKARLGVHRLVFAVPLVRELALWFGCVDVGHDAMRAQIERGTPVLLVPGGCREMIREVKADDDAEEGEVVARRTLKSTAKHNGTAAAELADTVWTHRVTLLLSLLALHLVVWACWGPPVQHLQLLVALLVLLSGEAAYYLYCNATPQGGVYELQTRHRGFLALAYELRVPVVPVLHHGQHRVFRQYSVPRLDALRTWALDRFGYPFPSLFVGPLPAKLSTHVYEPLDPQRFESADAFAEHYYTVVCGHYRRLCQ